MAVVERITRTIFNPCWGLSVKHQVVFGRKDKHDQKRRSELYQHNYTSQRYSDVTSLTSFSLETSDYLFLEKYNKDADKETVFFSYPHLFKLKRALKNAMKWFYDDEFEHLFSYTDGDMIVNSDFKGIKEEIYNLISNNSIIIIPDVVEIESELYEGVTLFLNNENQYVQMTIDQVEAFYDFFSTFDLYQSSQLLINYVTSMNPENITSSGSSANRKGNNRGGNLELKKKKKVKKSKEDKE